MLHAFKITEVRDIDAVAQADFQKNSSLWDFNLFVVYQELDHETPNDGLLAATKE
jgi:hypothetical protein